MMTLSLADTLGSHFAPITMDETERKALLDYSKRENFVKALPVKLVDIIDPATGTKTEVAYYGFLERPETWITGALLLGIGALGFFVGRRTR